MLNNPSQNNLSQHAASPAPTEDAQRDALLRACFARAREHPFYRGLYRANDDHHCAAPLEKAALLAALSDFQPGRETHGVYLVRSGGSTHAPLIFPVDIAENHAQRDALARALRAAGVFAPGDVALNAFGYADLYRSAAIMDDVLERCDTTTLAVSAHARYQDMEAMARRFRPTHVLGTPSKLGLLAHYLMREQRRLDIPQLLYAGEVLRPSTRDLLCERLGVRRIWSLYGGAETGIWAWSDASAQPGLFAMLSDVVVEILSPDADGYGSIAVSNGYRQRFPVFRYRLGDVGRLIQHNGATRLELRGRDSRSFQFDELTFDLDPIIALAGNAESAQLQLRSGNSGRDCMAMLIVADPAHPMDNDDCRRIHAALAAVVQHAPDSAAVEVHIVDKTALKMDPATAKTPTLVDARG
jgi:phenylacetate-CoA ligase